MSGKDVLAETTHLKGRRTTQHKDGQAHHKTHDTGPAKLTKERHNKRQQAKRESENYIHSMKHKQRLSSAWAIDLSSDEQDNVMELYKQSLLDDHKTKLSETYPKEYSKVYSYEMDFGDDEYDLQQEFPTSSPTQKSKLKKKKKKTPEKKTTTFSDSKISQSPPVDAPPSEVETEPENEPQNDTGPTEIPRSPSPVPSPKHQQEENNDMPQELPNDSQEQVPDDLESNDIPDTQSSMCQDWDDRSSEPKDTGYNECNRSYEAYCCCEEYLKPKLLKEGSGLVYHPPNNDMLYGKLSYNYCTDVERDCSRYNDTVPCNDNLPCNTTLSYNPYKDTLPCNNTHPYNDTRPYNDTLHYSCCNENKLSWNDHYCEPPKLPDVGNKNRTYLGCAESEFPDVSLYSEAIIPNVHTSQRHGKNSSELAYKTSCRCNDRLAGINGNDNLLLDSQKVRRGDLFKKQTNNSTSSDRDTYFFHRYNLKHNLSGAWRQNKSMLNCTGYHVPCSYTPKKVVEPIREKTPDTYYRNVFNEQPSYQNQSDVYPANVMYSSCENRSNENPPPPLNQLNECHQDKTFQSYHIESCQHNPGALYSTYDNPPPDYHQEEKCTCQPYNLNSDALLPPYDNKPTSYTETNWVKNVYFQEAHQENGGYQLNPQNSQGQYENGLAKWETPSDPDLYFKDGCTCCPQQEPHSSYQGCSCQQVEATGSQGIDALPTVANKCQVWKFDGCKTWAYGSTDNVRTSKDSHNKHKKGKRSQLSGEVPLERKSSKIFKFILDAKQKTVTCCLLPENEFQR